ncbi:GNAT family N-acetyltransferase [Hydrogenophaga luteola]|uniref:GNAT family N-acetyltransferase n=1 Tax=Hydrogenophaga luteola TaxID=1591122 RepID=A0ABV7W157_9BURK
MPLTVADIESIERATLTAVAPERVEALDGWLLPMDHGTVGRAHSAVPLHHEAHPPALIDTIVQRYRDAGLRPVLRLPDVPEFEPWWPELRAQGFRREQPTLTQTGALDGLLALAPNTDGVSLDPRPDAAWMAMFLGEGLDPVDGASRSKALSRAEGMLFVSLREGGGETLACGAACFAQGWLSMHGLRTAASRRGRGLAGRMIRAMALEAQRRGITRAFLQVDASNEPALALYRRAGMTTAWSYAYWRAG